MDILAAKFWLQKQGSSDSEYEDALAIAEDKSRFAVADGATETSFSGVWAKQLVRAFVDKKLSIPIAQEELKPLQAKWKKIVHRRPLPWYAEEKVNDGAFAAFIGLEFSDENDESGLGKNWRAIAVGDCCLMQVRMNKIIEAFPIADASSFNDRPNLLSSILKTDEKAEFAFKTGQAMPSDVFFLMTDAMACWFLKEFEQGNQPWSLLETQDDSSFERFVDFLRESKNMKNDDVTLVQIDILK